MRKPLNVLQKVLTVNNPGVMEIKIEAPAAQGRRTGASEIYAANIGVIPRLSYHQKRIYNLLSDGIPRSAADITISLRMSDPRSVIRDLRHKGVPIADEWCKGVHGGRFKRYFVRKGGAR